MSDHIDCIVIGAGVIGLAIARELALAGRDVIIVEAAAGIGSGTSSRNSEVIHAGIYYRPGSLKAKLCVEGRALLYRYCEERQVAYRRCGKLLVATGAGQAERLQGIAAHAALNGVRDLQPIDTAQARELEPALQCTAALLSPSTGIVDSHALMQQLLADAEAAGAVLALQTEILAARKTSGGVTLDAVTADGEEMQLSASLVINAAGLSAPQLARRFEGLPEACVPTPYFAKETIFR